MPADASLRAHTNIVLFRPARQKTALNPGPYGDFGNPMSMACVYGLVPVVPGCNPETLTQDATGGSKVIILVDAFDYPEARKDLAEYSRHFGLPAITGDNFQIVYASGQEPNQDSSGGWEGEAALDLDMAHAMAPNAKLILVEAATDAVSDLYAANVVAGKLAAAAGGGEVSNSWGTAEYVGETSDESNFVGTNVVYLASTGDTAGTEAPSVFSNIIAVGGTSIHRGPNAVYVNQQAWAAGGGGSSAYVPVPSYQSSTGNIGRRVHKFRGAPDLAFDADPNSGVWIYDSYPYNGAIYGWLVIGGTSVASPAMAGVLNSAGSAAASTTDELATIYAGYRNKAYWSDIKLGVCGNNDGANALAGYDFCTGIGVPRGYQGK